MSTNEKTNIACTKEADNKNTTTNAENTKKELQQQSKTEETRIAAAQTATEEADEEEEEDIDTDLLFKRRQSIDMTPENTWFSLSPSGMISARIINAEGAEETFERVVILRSFPITAPEEFLSVREPDTKQKGRGSEIGIIRNLSDFDADTIELIRNELNLRYFTPTITKIHSAKEKFGYCHWKVETTSGHIEFSMNDPFNNVWVLEDGRVMLKDADGGRYVVPDPKKLDRQSLKCIELYI